MPASGEEGFFSGEGIHFSTPVLSAAAQVPPDKFSLLQQVLSISQKRKIKMNPKHEEPPQKLLSWGMGRRKPALRLLLRRARGSGASKNASIYIILFYGIKPEWHLVADKVSLCHTVEGCAARSCLELHLKPGNQMICPDNFCGKPQTSYASD